ncbi:MAG: valine--tRNA ligase [Thermoplasmata archaeon]
MTDAPRPELPSRFEPGPIEARWQAAWEAARAFRAPDAPDGPTFALILPPPNVTGILTLGHMLGGTLMDILARAHRMRGRATAWIPGVDHAGLATQVEVRRRLQREGIAFERLSRDEALREIERWRSDHVSTIVAQLKAAGFSLDWSRFRYTMDPGAVRATREVFVRLYEQGLIYRGERMVNWDVRLRTAISDLEVIHSEEDGHLYYLRYGAEDGGEGVVVATVRPETIFGDVAIAVHPDDVRYRSLIGRRVRVPLVERPVPVIADPAVDPAFGAGALKITPRHDPVDHEIGQRHPELEAPPDILDEEGRLTGPWVPEDLCGSEREAARTRVVERLKAAGRLERIEPYRHSVARSERSEAVIEPRLSRQWFVRMAGLAAPVREGVHRGEITLHPERWNRTFDRWMEGIQDWCISRQILWGHPIPVATCTGCGREIVTVEPPERCPACGGRSLAPDPDVLDTWFTSWLWPFVALGWPAPSTDRARYYPTQVLVTGRDIMFFWVARMMMAGYAFTGGPPFQDVYFSGMLRDEQGRRMSKHLGNSPDPLQVIRERGADTLRWALVFPNPTDEDGPFGTAALDGGRNFLTKLWNVTRFALPLLASPPGRSVPRPPPPEALENRWILSRCHATLREVNRALADFEFTRAATALHGFVWHDLADQYVELSKDALNGRRDGVDPAEFRSVLTRVLDRTLRMLHPFIPHVTEELWHAIAPGEELLARAVWPVADEADDDPVAEREMETVREAIRLLRNLRSEEKVPLDATPRAWVSPSDPALGRLLMRESSTIARAVRLASFELAGASPATDGSRARRVAPSGDYQIELPVQSIDRVSLEREREKLAQLLAKTLARLADPTFRARAPAAVVREAEAKASELATRIQRLDDHLKTADSSPGRS